MIRKILLVIVLVVLLIVGTFFLVNSCKESTLRNSSNPKDMSGEYRSESKNRNLEISSDEDSYRKTVANLNEGWANARLGNAHIREGRYNEGIEAYKKAYDVDPGNRVYMGDLLVEAYEKAGRYDEAISLTDEILNSQRLVAYGINKFSAIRTRLIAAKNASQE